jgi:glycerol-3-phosphate cytidylyltransferase
MKVRWRNIIGFTTGYFDIMHPGHVLMLEECKRYCDYLIVGVNDVESWETDSWEQPDGRHKDEPIWSPDERLMMVKSNKNVGEAFLFLGEEKLHEYLEKNQDRIDVRILGEDHKGKSYTGEGLNIKVVFNSRDHDYSTTNTVNRIIKKRSK